MHAVPITHRGLFTSLRRFSLSSVSSRTAWMLGSARQISGCLSLQCWLRLPSLPQDLAQLLTEHLQYRSISSAFLRIRLPFSALRSLLLANSSSSYLPSRTASCPFSSSSCFTWLVSAMFARKSRQYSWQQPSSCAELLRRRNCTSGIPCRARRRPSVRQNIDYTHLEDTNPTTITLYRLLEPAINDQETSINDQETRCTEQHQMMQDGCSEYLNIQGSFYRQIGSLSSDWEGIVESVEQGLLMFLLEYCLLRLLLAYYKQITDSSSFCTSASTQMDQYSLQAQLRTPKLQAQLFFQTQGIARQILSNINLFIAYCRSHPAFSKSMLVLALNTPYSRLEDPAVKTASHAVTEVLCSEESAIAELFFQENMEDIPDESPISGEEGLGEGEGELQEHELVTVALQILAKPESNETCLGYLQKLFTFLIRHNPEPVLNYFAAHPHQLDLLLSNLRFCSVSSLVAQLLTSEDRTKAYKHEKLKRRIVELVVRDLFEKAEEWEAFEGTMVLVEEILNTTKQSYYEYFEDFKRAANLLVDREVLQRFMDLILERHEPSFRSASLFLELLFARINSEGEDNSYYHRGEDPEPSMNFEIDIFLENMPALIELVEHIEAFQSLTKISYLSFLEGLLRCARAKKYPFSLCQPAFVELFDSLNRQPRAGVYRNKLYALIAAAIDGATPQEVSQFLQENQQLWRKYFASIREANYSNTKVYNMNESSAFDVGIIHHLAKKDAGTIDSASKAIGKDFKRICKKYETKVASYHTNSCFSAQEEFSFHQISPEKISRIPTLSLDLINKNIVIALPNHVPTQNTSAPPRQRTEQTEMPLSSGIREVQQIEQVIVLTDAISHQPTSINEAEKVQQHLGNQNDDKPTTVLGQTEKQASLKIKDKIEGHVNRVRYFVKHISIFG